MLEPIIDIALWQSLSRYGIHFDWDESIGKIYGVIIKATGGLYTDPEFIYNWETSKSFNFARGAYHFFLTEVSPIVQAAYFVEKFNGDFGELPLFVDVESNNANLAPYQFRNNIKLFLLEVDRLTNKTTGIYTRATYWDANVAPPGQYSDFLVGRPAWFAAYNPTICYVPLDWKDRYGDNCWDLWQYSADGNNRGAEFGSTGEKDIDINRFNGSLADYNKKFNVCVLPLPGVTYTKAKSLVNSLRIREFHSTTSKIVGYLNTNDSPEVLEEYKEGGNIWVRIGWKQWCAMKYGSAIYMAYI